MGGKCSSPARGACRRAPRHTSRLNESSNGSARIVGELRPVGNPGVAGRRAQGSAAVPALARPGDAKVTRRDAKAAKVAKVRFPPGAGGCRERGREGQGSRTEMTAAGENRNNHRRPVPPLHRAGYDMALFPGPGVHSADFVIARERMLRELTRLVRLPGPSAAGRRHSSCFSLPESAGSGARSWAQPRAAVVSSDRRLPRPACRRPECPGYPEMSRPRHLYHSYAATDPSFPADLRPARAGISGRVRFAKHTRPDIPARWWTHSPGVTRSMTAEPTITPVGHSCGSCGNSRRATASSASHGGGPFGACGPSAAARSPDHAPGSPVAPPRPPPPPPILPRPASGVRPVRRPLLPRRVDVEPLAQHMRRPRADFGELSRAVLHRLQPRRTCPEPVEGISSAHGWRMDSARMDRIAGSARSARMDPSSATAAGGLQPIAAPLWRGRAFATALEPLSPSPLKAHPPRYPRPTSFPTPPTSAPAIWGCVYGKLVLPSAI